MKKLIALIFVVLVSISFYADARLVSGTAAHQHQSASGGGSTLSPAVLNIPAGTNLNGGPLTATTATFSGAVSSTKACATGYTRLTPNYCLRTSGVIDTTGGTQNTACQISNTLSGVSTAVAVDVNISMNAETSNVAGSLRSVTFNSFLSTDTSCATINNSFTVTKIEEVACLTCQMGEDLVHTILKSNTSGQYRFTYTGNFTNGNWNANHYIVGYYD